MWTTRARDALVRCQVGNLRISAVMAKSTTYEMANRWKLPTVSETSRVWGEYMAGTTMLSSFFKSEERMKVSVRTPEIEDMFIEAMALGEVRGKGQLVDSSTPATSIVDQGRMHVSKVLYGAATPYETTIPATGNAQKDWQTFYDMSEQVPTIIHLDSALQEDKDDVFLHCCGVTIQQMPHADVPDEHTYALDDLLVHKYPLAAADVQQNGHLVDYLNEVIPKADLTADKCRRIPVDYFCRCSKQGFGARLQGLGTAALSDVIDQAMSEGINLTCQFCNANYAFSLSELNDLRASD